jgi:hypothetical protein
MIFYTKVKGKSTVNEKNEYLISKSQTWIGIVTKEYCQGTKLVSVGQGCT